jgi:hypothetical protein
MDPASATAPAPFSRAKAVLGGAKASRTKRDALRAVSFMAPFVGYEDSGLGRGADATSTSQETRT